MYIKNLFFLTLNSQKNTKIKKMCSNFSDSKFYHMQKQLALNIIKRIYLLHLCLSFFYSIIHISVYSYITLWKTSPEAMGTFSMVTLFRSNNFSVKHYRVIKVLSIYNFTLITTRVVCNSSQNPYFYFYFSCSYNYVIRALVEVQFLSVYSTMTLFIYVFGVGYCFAGIFSSSYSSLCSCIQCRLRISLPVFSLQVTVLFARVFIAGYGCLCMYF